jgi:energy-coupling factor transporter ATP-binding protein EcfA2
VRDAGVPYRPRGPLDEEELQIVRGMIDDYRYRHQRDQRWRARLSRGQKLVVALAALYALSIPMINLVLTLRRN